MNNARTLEGLYKAFATGDIPTVLAGFDESIRWSEAEGNPYMPTGEAWVGPQAVLENLFMKLGTDWESFAVHPATYHDAGDSVVVEGRYTGKHATTGANLDAQFCHVWTFASGKATKFQQYCDTAQMQVAMDARPR